MKTKTKTDKVRTALYLSNEAHHLLWMKRVNETRTVSDIVNEILLSALRPKADRRSA